MLNYVSFFTIKPSDYIHIPEGAGTQNLEKAGTSIQINGLALRLNTITKYINTRETSKKGVIVEVNVF